MNEPIQLTPKELSEKGIGIFNGKLMGLGYNRELKRKYLKEHKKDKNATYCIFCKGNTLTIIDDYNKPICELCGIIKGDGVNE